MCPLEGTLRGVERHRETKPTPNQGFSVDNLGNVLELLSGRDELYAAMKDVTLPDNALRLNEGFSLATFSARTGLPVESLQPQLNQLLDRELLQEFGGKISTTELGRRFLDTIVAEFFPD